jgi:hypothetical protein
VWTEPAANVPQDKAWRHNGTRWVPVVRISRAADGSEVLFGPDGVLGDDCECHLVIDPTPPPDGPLV